MGGGVELLSVVTGRWSGSTGREVASRSFRNLQGISFPAEKTFFTDSNSFVYWLRADRWLLRMPEHRFTMGAAAGRRIRPGRGERLAGFGAKRGYLGSDDLARGIGEDCQ